jgi:hypothetical protein
VLPAAGFCGERLFVAWPLQVELMWQKFGAGIWQALSTRYASVDMAQVSWSVAGL